MQSGFHGLSGPDMEAQPVRLHMRQIRKALRRADLSDTFTVGKYAFSPYMACEHGCAYCDGRAERYYVEGEFDGDIVVRRNLPDQLAQELPRLREPGFVTIGSGISDAYQPVEAEERITRRCLEVLVRHRFPVTLMTKSALVRRDEDLITAINARSRCLIIMSLVHADDQTRAAFEPRTSTVQDRLQALRAFKAAGCATGVLAMPLLPGITDDESSIQQLYRMVAACNVDFVQPGGLTLRPGRQKAFYMDRLRAVRPDLLALYERLYQEERASGAPRADYGAGLMARCREHQRRCGIPCLVPHSVYHGQLMVYDEVAVLLRHMVDLYQELTPDTARLRRATRRYMTWITDRKRAYNRHRSWDYRALSAELTDAGKLDDIVDNRKLASFLRRILQDDVVLDYITLTLKPAAAGTDDPQEV